MKMKAVCERTGLTERAVRLYIERELLSPECKEQRGRTYYEFHEDDITMLHTISVLRGIGFSLEDIHTMICDAKHIAPLYQKLVETTREKAAEYQEIAAKLQSVRQIETCENVQELAERIEQSDVNECIRNSSVKNAVRQNTEEMTYRFGEFDPETEEEKERMYREYLGHYYLRAKRSKRFAKLRKVLAPVLDPLERVVEWGKRRWNYIWRIALILFLVVNINLLIPRKVSSCLHRDYMLEKVYVIVHEWDWESATGEWILRDYELDEEAYAGLLEILENYRYHGYLTSLLKDSTPYIGQTDIITIYVDYSNPVAISSDGEVRIDHQTYYLDWIGRKKSEELCDEVIEYLKQYEERDETRIGKVTR